MTMQDDASFSDAPQGNVAYQHLIDDLRAGRLTAGDRLRETELAERFGVSRTPIREAIRQLEADGIVTHLPRQGATIRSLEYVEVMDLYEMRAVLEGTAARLAARAASDIEIDELCAMNEELAAAGATPEAFRLNRQFHIALTNAAKNRFLAKSTQTLQKTLLIMGPTTLIQPERAIGAVQEHIRVLDAIRARDGAKAEQEMRKHIEVAQRVRMRQLRLQERSED
ncbi:GntR family transcriptional regulator [Donghicola mangrovi]|uniref:GntR family transcriptional regulator n=1 Tax=Donghicola mangrovi TaxID=2729614 RepID=A0A850QBK0_9RHOB|nr:GntR family transcriptional regulator [Donghicola mangrovi]NVO24318.1 GntR family transcriptional regulator [Donghicola mangrovi]